jgi:hypothetical protein
MDHATLLPYHYIHIFARVSEDPSLCFSFYKESREMFIPHLPETVRGDEDENRPALYEATFEEQLALSKELLVANSGTIAALMEDNAALTETNAALNAEIDAFKKDAASSRSSRARKRSSTG